MGKPLDKIVSTIRNQLTGHLPTDDTRLEGELIEDMILDVRAIVIRDFYKSNYFLEDSFFQIHNAVEVKSINVSPVEGLEEENPELYSDVPVILSGVGFANVRYFGTIDNRNSFARLSTSGFNVTEGKLFTRNGPYYTISGNKITLKNLPNLGIKYLRMIAIFYDPRKVYGFNPLLDFPVPDSMIHKVELITIRQLSSTLGIPPDIINDAQDVIVQERVNERK